MNNFLYLTLLVAVAVGHSIGSAWGDEAPWEVSITLDGESIQVVDWAAAALLKNDGTRNEAHQFTKGLKLAASVQKPLYLRPGYYTFPMFSIPKSLGNTSGVTIIGNPANPAILSGPPFVQFSDFSTFSGWSQPLTLDGLVFDVPQLSFFDSGKSHEKKTGLKISRCIFISYEMPGASNRDASLEAQLYIKGLSQVEISKSVFMNSHRPIAAISAKGVEGLKISNNVFGVSFNEMEWLDTEWLGALSWSQRPLQRLGAVREVLFDKLHGYSRFGDYSTAITIHKVAHMVNSNIEIERNILNRFPKSKLEAEYPIAVRCFARLRVTQNYVTGWPTSKKGMLLISNGFDALVAGNNLKGSGIQAAVFAKNRPPVLKDVTICSNVYDLTGKKQLQRQSYGIRVWRNYLIQAEDLNVSSFIPESNIVIYNNTFIHAQRKKDRAFLKSSWPVLPIYQSHESAMDAFTAVNNTYEDGELVVASNMAAADELTPQQMNGCDIAVPTAKVGMH